MQQEKGEQLRGRLVHELCVHLVSGCAGQSFPESDGCAPGDTDGQARQFDVAGKAPPFDFPHALIVSDSALTADCFTIDK